MNDLLFENQVVAISGAASGIGRTTAIEFAKRGAAVSLLDISGTVRGVVDEILTFGGRATQTIGDVSQATVVDEFHTNTLRVFGHVNHLINNAGIDITDRGNLIKMPWGDVERIIQVNLFGYMHCCRAFIPSMPKGGRVVNVSSVQAFTAHRPCTSYQASKGAIVSMTQSLAVEYGPRGINVNAVAPGAIAIEGVGNNTRAIEPKIGKAYNERIPLGRRGKTEEIAWPILFLCSPWAAYINGTCLVIDGGYTIDITPNID